MNLEQAKQILFATHMAALESGTRAYGYVLQSGPGIGKTDSVFQDVETLAQAIEAPVGLSIHMLAEVTGPDVRGFLMPVRRENARPQAVFLDPTWYPTIDNTWVCEPVKGSVVWHRPGTWSGELPVVGIVFLDEWGQTDEDVRKAAAPLIHQGNVGTCALPLTWRVVAAQNRPSDRSGVSRELMHIVNRRALLDIDADFTTWDNWADNQPADKRPHPATRAFARKETGIVFRATLPDSTDPYCTPRTLCMMDRDIRVLRNREEIDRDRMPMSDLARELCASFIGKASAAQFYTHLRFAEELPDFDDILDNPGEAKVPAGKDAQMICAYMLADLIDDETAKPIFTYIKRLAKEMQIMAVGVIIGKVSRQSATDDIRTAAQIRRAKALAILPDYTDWLVRNQETLIASQM